MRCDIFWTGVNREPFAHASTGYDRADGLGQGAVLCLASCRAGHVTSDSVFSSSETWNQAARSCIASVRQT